MRHELDDTGVTVTALMPGPTNTDFFRRADMEDTVVDSMPKDDPADVAGDGLEAMFDGKDRVVAYSWRTKVQAATLKKLPEPVKASVPAMQTKEKE